jgi:hypothetical protein
MPFFSTPFFTALDSGIGCVKSRARPDKGMNKKAKRQIINKLFLFIKV